MNVSRFVAVFFSFLLFSGTCFAAPDLSVTSASGTPGSTVPVSVIADFSNVVDSIQFELQFDPNLLAVSNVTIGAGDLAWAIVSNPNTAGEVIIGIFNLAGPLSAVCSTGLSATCLDQQIAIINFTVKNPPGDTSTVSSLMLSNVLFDKTSLTQLTSGELTLNLSYPLTVNISGKGTVSQNPDLLSYQSGSQVVLTATPSSGYQFSDWSGDAAGSTNPLTLTIKAATSVTANFSSLTGSPVVAITSPANGSSFPYGSNVTNTATASEPNGKITNISFYNVNGLITSCPSSPCSFQNTDLAAGTYTHYVKATDANGVTVTSSPVSFTVTGPLVAAITAPANGSSFPIGSNVTNTATASETNGKITNISFYNSKGLITSCASSPCSFQDTNLAAGSYSHYVKATDAHGVTVTSTPATFTVAGPMVAITNPANGSSFPYGSNLTNTATAAEVNGTVTNISFYNTTGLITSCKASPCSFQDTNLSAGVYTHYAKATDAHGVTNTSGYVTFTVTGPLEAAITAPADGSSFPVGSNVINTATASEANGKITNISFYNSKGLITSCSSSPCSFQNTNLPAGAYSHYIKVTDAHGVTVTSSAVAFTVK